MRFRNTHTNEYVDAEQFDSAVLPLPFQDQRMVNYDGIEWYVIINGIEGERRIVLCDGDWIIRNSNGSFRVCSDTRFKNVFETAYGGADEIEKLDLESVQGFKTTLGTLVKGFKTTLGTSEQSRLRVACVKCYMNGIQEPSYFLHEVIYNDGKRLTLTCQRCGDVSKIDFVA